MRKLRWSIWGLDLIAEEFASALEQKQLPYSIICEHDEQTATFIRKHENVHAYKNLDDMLADNSADIIYISSYGHRHFSCIMQCLEKGRHVLCEKSMFTNFEEAQEAFAYAEKQKLFLGEANTVFYMPLYKEISNVMQNGRIGKLKMIRADFGSLKEETEEAAIYRKDYGGGALLDIGIYALSAALKLMGTDIETVSAIGFNHTYGVDERWTILLKNTQQILGCLDISIRSKLDKRLIIAGERAYIEIYDYHRGDHAVIVYPDGSKESITCGSTAQAVLYEIEKVQEYVCAGCQDPNRFVTIEAMNIMKQIYRNEGK